MRILLATAGRPESRGALRVASALARREQCPVLVLGVAMPFPHDLSTLVSMHQPMVIDEQNRRAILASVRRSLRNIDGADGWEKRVFVGMPPDEIQAVAERCNASLIVLGLGRHNRVDRIVGSETAVAVMRHTRIPVLAVRTNASRLPTRAVAAIDFTPASLAAASLAAELLAEDGTLVVAHVCAFGDSESRPGDLIDLYRAGARAKLDDAVRTLEMRTTRAVQGVMLEGDPGKSIVRYARKDHCDLIALGGHEMGLVDRVLLGSVRTRVVRDAPCSVLIAPPDRVAAAAD